jgi:release factor glutamine methyltransferase
MRLDDWLRATALRLDELGIESTRLEAQMLAAHVLMVDRTWVVAHPDAEFPDLAGESILQRRLNREPLAYILGWREFYGRRFRVGPGVLIPRQETEILVEAALEVQRDDLRVLDVGTGSGCIAITLQLERPTWNVSGLDISERALEMAAQNARGLSAEKVKLILADGLGQLQKGAVDLIVSNPPYVSRMDDLSPEIADFEPELALYAGGNGLDFYRRFSEDAKPVLTKHGMILMELGAGQLDDVRSMFELAGWKFGKSWKDLSGIDRVIAMRV